MSSELPRQCIYITNLNYMANVGDGVLRNIRSNVWSGEAGWNTYVCSPPDGDTFHSLSDE